MQTKQAIHCYIIGKVQGVWFRSTTKEQAELLGLTGWVRNLPDGRVELMAYGEGEKLEILHQWLKQGPPLAQVSEVIREELAWFEYSGFRVL